MMTREHLGRLVRGVWIAWAQRSANPKSSWLVPWEDLQEDYKEVDRRIGEEVRRVALTEAIDDLEEYTHGLRQDVKHSLSTTDRGTFVGLECAARILKNMRDRSEVPPKKESPEELCKRAEDFINEWVGKRTETGLLLYDLIDCIEKQAKR